MINVQGISKYYNSVKAVNKVSFEVKKGQTLILLGPSGCGKTTTLRMLNRLIEPSEGIIKLDGKDISNQQPEILRRGIGYVLQHTGLFPHYTVAENIAIVPKLLNWDKQKIEKRSAELLEKLELEPGKYLHSYPGALSGGQQQRVGLARALMANPPVLLMDEPLGALDPITRSNIRQEFNRLDELREKTIVMVTHDIAEAFELGDNICLMNHGIIQQIGTPYQLLFEPQNSFVKDFFNEQRLQLELTVLSIADVWGHLSEQKHSESTMVSKGENLWEVLDSLQRSGSNRVRVNNPASGEQKVIGYRELMTAYSDFKNSVHE
ncbi:ATP-binding cassette domain-containing protein [Flavihumibacter sp. R14]|nr:ATP-binding cassette domain-containing protein [Flavihumibacter soli]